MYMHTYICVQKNFRIEERRTSKKENKRERGILEGTKGPIPKVGSLKAKKHKRGKCCWRLEYR